MITALAGFVGHAHGQCDALAGQINFQHLDLHDLACLDYLVRVLDEGVGQRRDMHQTILMHADIDEGTKGRDVGDDAFEDHAGLQILHFGDAVGEGGRLELRARVATGFFQFLQDVLNGRQAEALVGIFAGVDGFQAAPVTEQFLDRLFQVDNDFLDDRIGFRVHRRGIKRVVAVRHAQEAGGLLEGLVTQARYLLEVVTRAEGAVGVAIADDVGGESGIETRNPGQQRHGSRVNVDADRIHAVFHHGIERAGKLGLRDVVLVLANADRLGFDLVLFGQRVLQAAGDRHGAPNRDVEIGEFLGGEFGGRIHRGAGFGDDDLLQAGFRVFLHHVLHQLVGFAAGRAVADGDQRHAMHRGQAGDRRNRPAPVVTRFVRVDGGGVEQLAGGVDDGDLAAGADAGVDAHGYVLAGRGGEQQVLQVLAEDADGFFLGALTQFVDQFQFEVGEHLDLPGPAHGVGQPLVGRAALRLDAEAHGDALLAGVLSPRLDGFRVEFGVEDQRNLQHAFVAAAEQGQGAVRGHGRDRLGEVEPVAELGAFGFLAFDHCRADVTVVVEVFAQLAKQFGVFGEFFHQDLAGTVEYCLGVGKADRKSVV